MGDAIITGSGTINPGVYDNVKISGSGKVNGDIECKLFSCSGSGKIAGNITCGGFSCSGGMHVYGKIISEGNLKCSGAVNAESDVNVREAHISGASSIGGSMSADKLIHVSGTIKVNGSMSAEEIEVSGALNVKGLVNAEKFTLSINSFSQQSSADSIGGSIITVRQTNGNDGFLNNIIGTFFPSREESILTVKQIEGDTIELVNTTADIVRGNNITIGDKCKIRRVEYTGKVTYSDNATIGEMVEI